MPYSQTAEDVLQAYDIRIPGESPGSFVKFQHYLTLGTERSLQRLSSLARQGAFTEGVPARGYGLSNLEDLSSRNNWAARAAEYDRDALLRQREEWEERRSTYLGNMWDVSVRTFERVLQMLDHPITTTRTEGTGKGKKTIVERDGWALRDVAAIARTAALLGEAVLAHQSVPLTLADDISHVPTVIFREKDPISSQDGDGGPDPAFSRS